MYDLKHLDFEEILKKLPCRFTDADLYSIPATQEMIDKIAPDVTGTGMSPIEAANIMHFNKIIETMIDLGLIEFDELHLSCLKLGYKKVV